MIKQQILDAIDAHAKQFGLKHSTICQMALSDRNLYQRLLCGGDMRLGSVDKLTRFLHADAAKRIAKSADTAGQ